MTLRTTRAGRWSVRPATAADEPRWRELFAGYAAFYRAEPSPADVDRVWSWILDPEHEVSALLLQDADGQVAGLAHYRPFADSLAGRVGCYLEDLYVDAGHRGTGGADALLQALRELAAGRGWNVVRWITADDNYRARAVYDRNATRTTWVTYDMTPEPHPA